MADASWINQGSGSSHIRLHGLPIIAFAISTVLAFVLGVTGRYKKRCSFFVTNSFADASKHFLYSINHTQMEGYTTNPPPGYTQSIAVGPLSNKGVHAIVSQTATGSPTTLPNPAYLTIFDKNGKKLSAEQLPVQVIQNDCTLPRFDMNVPGYYLFDVCPSLSYSLGSIQNQRGHDFVKVWVRKYRNLDNKYSSANYYLTLRSKPMKFSKTRL